VEEEHLALAVREQLQREAELGGAGFEGEGDSKLATPLPSGVARRVDDDRPDPGFEVALATEAASLAERLCERFLYRVAARFGVTRDRGRGSGEVA
jgi:hypothetical protein